MTGRWSTDRPRPVLVGAVVVGAGLFAIATFAVAYAAGVSVSALTRDVGPTQDLPWYLGTFSWLGVLIWFGGSSIAFAASWIAAPPNRGFLRTLGIFGIVLAMDDGFTLHDHTLPDALGDPVEMVIYALYAVTAVWIALKWWRILTPTAILFAAASVALLGASVLGDVVGAPSFVEDGLKFGGIAAWTGLAVTQSEYAIRTSGQPGTDG